jgi:hypothetical protein
MSLWKVFLVVLTSKRKNWKVAQALHEQNWIAKIDLTLPFSLDHLSQFIDLCSLLSQIVLHVDQEDDIVWRLTANGEYSSKSAYEIQFLGYIASPMNKCI